MGAGEDREADRVGVLLDDGGGYLLRSLVQPGVDHLHAGVTQGAGDDLGAAVVPVEPGLGDDNADLAAAGLLAHRRERSARRACGRAAATGAGAKTRSR